ncbi:cytochrome oxidase subunit X [Trypanosoma equiperdum]|uniref:Cytochrome c oxidase subunit 10, putative n=4 Tax=Trypanozoon TaxID=39700 RepID=Q382M2_TRYB2|nr:cytochrome c oxidase subunit 10, putative [Trypanosoma brucei gambiense DAL972]XP_829371.1 cytochrome c oxidase subunit 10, putative [Trypanosoma brucei brucei TREU927]RHW67753.1 cytochrome oxidase subunit X [Trypanosoma brucei equiperdum]SCU65517.1 cytochrome oxidase subunit X [Trypanosoma equiperdum]EAN80259.1 cytochrome c oxidase subunit 10, putative [Trypanosoma brucei brucei TREU927]RHW67817.1 cytochrome oxidase subunit X [Trypanosoma brucei equiperdum]RHW67951.1 cytochrome oxidase su|eukprot:XP_011780611.1 cytochrome c oxidase subunit 10, putative [Trypanosoma brucei gambiense DAL972]
MLRRAGSRVACACSVPQARSLHFPITPPPIEIEYLDNDPLEFAVRTEARKWRFDDMGYMRELAFVRINNNPTVGDFRNMSPDERRNLFWGSDRQDFFRHLTCTLTGSPEHLYHRGW